MLRVENLATGYDGDAVLRDVTLDFDVGSRVALLGLNGAGKTTLFRVIAGLLPCWRGSVTVDGADPRETRRRALEGVGIMWDDEPGPGWATPRQLLSWVVEVGRLDPDHVGWALDWAGLDAFADKPIEELSHGQRRRVELGVVAVQRPRFLLLDEPTTGMDLPLKQRLWGQLEKAPTLLLATHDPVEVTKVTNRVVVLHEGTVVLDAPVEEVREASIDRTVETLNSWMEHGRAPA